METEPSVPSAVLISALRRQVQAAGGFVTMLSRGDPYGSAMLIVHRDERRNILAAYERVPGIQGLNWRKAASGDEVDSFVRRQCRFDPDLWVIELDIDDPARFIPAFPKIC